MSAPFFHVGVLVRDIEAAAATFGQLLGVSFEPTRTATLATGEVSRYRYSESAPPFIELIEISGPGAFAGPAEGLHHLGVEEVDVPGRCAVLAGETQKVVVDADGAALVAYSDPVPTHGVRLEFVASQIVAARLGAAESHPRTSPEEKRADV